MPPRPTALPGDVEGLLVAGQGLFTLRAAEQAGISRYRIHRLVAAELLVRLAEGVYARREEHDDAGPWQAFALRSRAFVAACGPDAYAAGWSAVAILGLPAISPPPLPPLALVPRGSRTSADTKSGRVRSAWLPPEHRTTAGGTPITTPARTVADIARTSERANALVVADAAASALVPAAEIRRVVELQRGWPGSTEARWVVQHADPYAESALETLGRLAFIESGLPVPVSNPWVDLGGLRYRPDHLLDDLWLVFEGDGADKYNRADAARVIEQQREREWHLRQAGFEIERYGWRLARYDRPQLAERFHTAITARPPRPRPYQWYRDTRTYRRAA